MQLNPCIPTRAPAEQIKKHQWFGYLGLFVILIVAIQLIIGGLNDLNILEINESFKSFF